MRYPIKRSLPAQAGVTLMDALVASAVMLLVFVGIAGAFKLSIDAVLNNKARAGAVALADERMEYTHSLTYDAVGTVGGIPSGMIAQSETISLNGITYIRRTTVKYEDDPKDGLGINDVNNVVEDYKSIKVDVSWVSRSGARDIVLVARISPAAGIESLVPGGTLIINSIDAQGQPLAGASLAITNASTSPAISINTFTNASGTAMIYGAPGAIGYHIVVTKPGYSTAQTYAATAQNTSPDPGNLTVVNYQITSSTFGIDVLASKAINTWTQILTGAWTDSFADSTKVATSSNISVSGGSATLSEPAPYPTDGTIRSIAIEPSYLAAWQTLTIDDTTPASTSILYHLYDGGGENLIPDTQLPGNAAGFASGTIDISGVSTSTYPAIRIGALFNTTDASSTPALNSWSANFTYGPQPLGNIAFNLQGAKTIGTGVHKYDANLSTGSAGTLFVPNLEWDTYTISVGGATGYDIASACNPQPESLDPGASQTTNLYLTAHSNHSLLVDVRSANDNSLVTNANVTLSRTGFSATSATDACGQSFFKNVENESDYVINVTAAGHTPYSISNIDVSGTTRFSVPLN